MLIAFYPEQTAEGPASLLMLSLIIFFTRIPICGVCVYNRPSSWCSINSFLRLWKQPSRDGWDAWVRPFVLPSMAAVWPRLSLLPSHAVVLLSYKNTCWLSPISFYLYRDTCVYMSSAGIGIVNRRGPGGSSWVTERWPGLYYTIEMVYHEIFFFLISLSGRDPPALLLR